MFSLNFTIGRKKKSKGENPIKELSSSLFVDMSFLTILKVDV
jgi:hypothetical protein